MPENRFRDDDRVTVTDTTDRHYDETGLVCSWFYGLANPVVYLVQLDGREDLLPYLDTQLELGDNVYA
jgi:hypothetical protein